MGAEQSAANDPHYQYYERQRQQQRQREAHVARLATRRAHGGPEILESAHAEDADVELQTIIASPRAALGPPAPRGRGPDEAAERDVEEAEREVPGDVPAPASPPAAASVSVAAVADRPPPPPPRAVEVREELKSPSGSLPRINAISDPLVNDSEVRLPEPIDNEAPGAPQQLVPAMPAIPANNRRGGLMGLFLSLFGCARDSEVLHHPPLPQALVSPMIAAPGGPLAQNDSPVALVPNADARPPTEPHAAVEEKSVHEVKESEPPPSQPAIPVSEPPNETDPERLKHPIYNQLPLLNIINAALHYYPNQSQPVSDPVLEQSLASMQSVPLPSTAPTVVTVTDANFLVTDFLHRAHQQVNDYSYGLLHDIVKACRDTGEKFIDRDFMPDVQSLFGNYAPLFEQFDSRNFPLDEFGLPLVNDASVRWLRLTDCAKPSYSSMLQQWKLINDDISINAIKFNHFNSNHSQFHAVLGSLATKYPRFVQSLFLTRAVNAEGVYQIRLCVNGCWQILTVDDYVPVLASQAPRFTHAVDAQLWPALLEKALAKSYGCYKSLQYSSPEDVFSDLTGCPSFSIRLHQPTLPQPNNGNRVPLVYSDRDSEIRLLWHRLLDYLQRGCVFTAQCDFTHLPKWESSEDSLTIKYYRQGLMPHHSYTVLELTEQHDIKFVKLRNPFGGRMVWHGQYRDGPIFQPSAPARQQQQEEKQLVTYNKPQPRGWRSLFSTAMSSANVVVQSAASYPKADSGVFWMRWEDFLQYFTSVSVCQFLQQWQELRVGAIVSVSASSSASSASASSLTTQSLPHYTSRSLTQPQLTQSASGSLHSQHMYELVASSPTHAVVTITQPDYRTPLASSHLQPRYQPLGIAVLQSTNPLSSLSTKKFSFVPGHWKLIGCAVPVDDRQCSCEVWLPSLTSRYLIVPQCWSVGTQPLSVIVTVQSDRPLYMRRLSTVPGALLTSRLLTPPLSLTMSSLSLTTYGLQQVELAPQIYLLTVSLTNSVCYVFRNCHRSSALHVSFDATRASNCVSSRAVMRVYDVVPPCHEMIVMVLAAVCVDRRASYQIRHSFTLSQSPTLSRFVTGVRHYPPLAALDYHCPRPVPADHRS